VVRHHVAQGAGDLVELAALLDADRLGGGDLHVIDAVAVPDRLEQAIGEAERHDRLHRILAEKMIDAEDLVLVEGAPDLPVERLGRGQIVAERLFDNDAAPEIALAVAILVLVGEPGLAEVIDYGAEEAVGDGEIEDDVAL